ncbi:LysE family translocator [Marivita hallyeonensis]|uniref:Threonine/homoserine/homoserine lactone efflux protein n=1 Tax=Marivita hallyeonensis TaxID=996342 RepID=A0A1M5LZH7_9RHOB|nr:LysE family translocator [Marivita hallyeonensis]SHG70457.1 Threonine/homoserine/homoserine lactone efflux protein [Marivita hallyeonensis]
MLAEWLPNLLAGWAVQLLGVLSPGPGVALILTVATTQGRTAAITTCFGIATGAVCLVAAAVIGLGALVAEVAWAMTAIKLMGAAYLSWLAWNAFGRAVSPPPPPSASFSGLADRRAGAIALGGFAMQVTNPKAIMYWLAAVAVANFAAAPWPIILIFILGGFVNSFVGHGAWAVALSSRPFTALYARGRRWVEATLGVFFAFTAYKLATTRI